MDQHTLHDPAFATFVRDHAQHQALAFLVHGSWADGFATPDSDVDILALTDTVVDSQPLASPMGRLHLEFCPHALVQREIAELDDQYRHRILDFSFLVARLRNGIVIHDPEGLAAELLARVRAYRPSPLTRRKFHIQAIAFRNDAVAALQHGDPVQALIASRLAVQSLGAGLLLNHGVTNLNCKWQHRFLKQLLAPQSKVLDHYEHVLGLAGETLTEEARLAVIRTLALINWYGVSEMPEAEPSAPLPAEMSSCG